MCKEMTDSEKTILTGRIYPAIQSCISNRYKIVVGYFAIVGFLLTINERTLKKFIELNGAAFLAGVFTIFVIHNSINYWGNAKEERELEKKGKKFPLVDILSSIVITILILGGYLFLEKFLCKRGDKMECDLQCWANISSVITLILTATVTIVGLWGYLSYRYTAYKKRRKLEQYLEEEKKKSNGKGQCTLLHLVRHVGLTEDEIIQISFKSKKIERRIKEDEEGYAKSLLFEYI
jgi:hypothetical protein